MGVFPEDSEIHVSWLIKLWIGEGFLKPIGGKWLEEVAEEYFKELIDRNLILAHKLGSSGKIKFCKIHDLLRDVCLREAEKQKFLCVLGQYGLDIPQGMHSKRRISIHQTTSKKEYHPRVLHALRSASYIRSLIWESQKHLSSFSFRLLRVLPMVTTTSLEDIFQQVNLRTVAVNANFIPLSGFPSSVCHLWNLQTLVVVCTSEVITAPSEIWAMPHLRHVKFWSVELADPPSGNIDYIVLESLQTLLHIYNFKCGEKVVKRIPNIKKLKVYYRQFEGGSLDYCLHNLGHLHKLESLACFCDQENMPSHLVRNLTFPHSLKKLTLEGTRLHWDDLTTKLGSLPLLQVLKLGLDSVIGPRWETVEGQFCSLKFLLMEDCHDLEYWTTDNTHFPQLVRLVLQGLDELREIPSCIGDITTLQSIKMQDCSDSVVESAKRIQEEQEELGNIGLQVFY